MRRLVFGTTNPGKLADARMFLKSDSVELLSLKDVGIDIDVEETGETFEENAWLKYHTLRSLIPEEVILVTDDGGVTIDALGGEPGVHTRRWNGTTMTDQEILAYCLEKMQGKKDRTAHFVNNSVIGGGGIMPQLLSTSLDGILLEEPRMEAFEEGLPFRALFYLPDHKKMLHEIHDTPLEKRPGFLTHREKIWQKIGEMVQDLPT